MADEDMKAELERLRAENERLKQRGGRAISMKVSEKGGLSVYGLGRFPVTLYKEQWGKLLDMADDLRAFIKENESKLKTKGDEYMVRNLLFLAVVGLGGCGGRQQDLGLPDLGPDGGATSPPSGSSTPKPLPPVPTPIPVPPKHPNPVGTLTCPWESVGDKGEKVTYDKSCTTAKDCAIGMHDLDCCGSQIELGINVRETDRFINNTGICHNGGPACDCAGQLPKAEDGARVSPADTVVVDCNTGMCRTRVVH